jgi:hypothetical protein
MSSGGCLQFGAVKVVTTALAAALLLTLAGCGSRSGKQQYVDKLNAMCEDFSKREQALGSDPSQRGDRIVAAFDAAIAEPIKELQAPPELAPQVARLRALVGQQHDVLKGLADAGRTGDVTRLRRLSVRNQQLNRQAGEIANELHAESCTSSG